MSTSLRGSVSPWVLVLVCSLPGTYHCWRQALPLRGSVVPARFHWCQSQRIPEHFSPEQHEVFPSHY